MQNRLLSSLAMGIMAACLSACADLDVAMYGSEEAAQEARENAKAHVQEEQQDKLKAEAARLHELVRQARQSHGLKSGPLLPEGQEVATMRAKELSRWYSPYRPDGKGWYYTLTKELKSKVEIRKELRSRAYKPESVLKEWLSKPESRDILLDRSYIRFGIGAYKSSKGTFWTFEKF